MRTQAREEPGKRLVGLGVIQLSLKPKEMLGSLTQAQPLQSQSTRSPVGRWEVGEWGTGTLRNLPKVSLQCRDEAALGPVDPPQPGGPKCGPASKDAGLLPQRDGAEPPG